MSFKKLGDLGAGFNDYLFHGQVDLASGFLTEIAMLGNLAPEEGMLLAFAKINRADALSHTPSRDHRPGQRGGTVDIVICARADAAQQQFLGQQRIASGGIDVS